jgi:sarcosine oxidase subunit beta
MSDSWDVVVVGAGSVGCPTAMELAGHGQRVLVIEALASAGQGQNKAAIGGVRATHSDPAKIGLCSQSLKIFASFEDEHGIHIGWKPGGYCFPALNEKVEATLKGILPKQKAAGLVIDWHEPDDIARIVPGIVRDGLRGGTFSPGDGQVSPLAAANAFQRVAERRGATFRFKERVTAVDIESGKVVAVRTDKGRYATERLVVATGAEARALGVMLGLDLPVTPDSHEAGITAPIAPFLDPLVVDLRPGPEGRTANFYFGQNSEGQIIFCYTPIEIIVGTNRESTSEFMPIVARRLVGLIPRLRHALVRRIWRGLYPMTPDGLPIVDMAPEPAGVALAVGMGGQGFMMGPGVGRMVASLLLDGRPSIDPEAAATIRYGRDYGATKEALK